MIGLDPGHHRTAGGRGLVSPLHRSAPVFSSGRGPIRVQPLPWTRMAAVTTTLTLTCSQCGRVQRFTTHTMNVDGRPWCVFSVEGTSTLLRSMAEVGARFRTPPDEGGLAFCTLACLDTWAHRAIIPGTNSLTIFHEGGGSVTIRPPRFLARLGRGQND